jgi:hypothetical protein
MAQQVFPLDDAPGPEDRQGGDGAALGDWSVLDVAQGVGLRASEKVRFAGSKILRAHAGLATGSIR